jgi:putative transposase
MRIYTFLYDLRHGGGDPASGSPPAARGSARHQSGAHTTFAVLSNQKKVAAPLGKDLQRLRRLSGAHSRKQRGSHNRQKAALRLARCHRRIANMRRDFLHKFTTKIRKNHAGIFVEDLNVKGMVQNRHLSRAIHDVGWSELRRQREYKSLLYGSVLTVRDRFYASSKTCSKCGYVKLKQ